MRPRAGHSIGLISTPTGCVRLMYSAVKNDWVPTGVANAWPRCKRCRRPEEAELVQEGLCNTCFYYSALPPGEFWNRKKDKFFPYTLGSRIVDSLHAKYLELNAIRTN